MSGHSKWSTIKRQKGATDAKRGQIFTKLSNTIAVAVRQGGGIADPTSNFKLRLAIEKARVANMPKDNIERAIQKGSGVGGSEVVELMYEGFGPGGVAMMVEAISDNKQRTVSDVKNIFEKNGGTLGSQGSVSYLFNRKGEVVVKKGGLNSDEILDKALTAGVEDIEEEGENVFFYVDAGALQEIKAKVEEQGFVIDSAELVYLPSTHTPVDENRRDQVLNLVGKLDELDDVQNVYTNLE